MVPATMTDVRRHFGIIGPDDTLCALRDAVFVCHIACIA